MKLEILTGIQREKEDELRGCVEPKEKIWREKGKGSTDPFDTFRVPFVGGAQMWGGGGVWGGGVGGIGKHTNHPKM